MSCALSLLALGIGYLVFIQGCKEKEGVKLLGQVIGILMMIGAVASGLCAARCHHKGSDCHPSSGKPMCPFSGKEIEEAK